MIVVGRNKKLRKKITGLEEQVSKHREKIEEEKKKPQPDKGVVTHWEAEIRALQKQIEQIRCRLPEGRKKQ